VSIHPAHPVPQFLVRPASSARPLDAHLIEGRLILRAHTLCPPHFSCRKLETAPKNPVFLLVAASVVTTVLLFPLAWLHGILAGAALGNLANGAIRIAALWTLARNRRLPDFLTPAPDTILPRITVLVPLFRETAALPGLIRALDALDYPRARLEIHLLTESVDTATAATLAGLALPPCMRVLQVPRDWLQTKPKAMNYALPHCTGDIITVYDAEDRPEPAQLRKVARAFAAAPADVACLQGQLDYHNARRNLITRRVTIEYAMWFRVVMHGVQALGLPIPLGGTTLFIRRAVLQEIGGWDAHNVTEDADLGMRLARFGYRTEIVQTTTWEESSHRPLGWIRQRSRWLKGFAMTWASHMRHPRRLYRDLGPAGFCGFHVLMLSGPTGFFAAPLFWVLWAGFFGLPLIRPASIFPPLWGAFIAAMIIGQLTFLAGAITATAAKPRRFLLPSILLLPLYWPLGALAAYKAAAELVFAPFYWDKTPHGGDHPNENAACPSPDIATAITAPGCSTNGG